MVAAAFIASIEVTGNRDQFSHHIILRAHIYFKTYLLEMKLSIVAHRRGKNHI
jgi:hypothetical protein